MNLLRVTQYNNADGDQVGNAGGYALGRSAWRDSALPQALLRNVGTGSAGVVVLTNGYGLFVPHVGTSPSVVDHRPIARAAAAPAAALSVATTERSALQAVLALPVAAQALEVLAALSLNKSQLAEVLGVTRPTLYDWLDGKEPNAANAERLTTVLRLLGSAEVTSERPLNARFVRQALSEHPASLLDALRMEALDERLIVQLLREAKALGTQATSRRTAREDRLRGMGFEDPSDEQKREQLARNLALRDWPKT